MKAIIRYSELNLERCSAQLDKPELCDLFVCSFKEKSGRMRDVVSHRDR